MPPRRFPPPSGDDEPFEEPPIGGALDYGLILWRVRQLEYEHRDLAEDVELLRRSMSDEREKQLRAQLDQRDKKLTREIEHAFTLRANRWALVFGGATLLLQLAGALAVYLHHT